MSNNRNNPSSYSVQERFKGLSSDRSHAASLTRDNAQTKTPKGIQKPMKSFSFCYESLFSSFIHMQTLKYALHCFVGLSLGLTSNALFADSTYESLTEDRGTFELLREKRAQAQKNKDLKNQASRHLAENDEPQNNESKDDLQSSDSEEVSSEDTTIINFNNVAITEVLKYISRLTGKNFVYDPDELQFSITMISDTPMTFSDIMAMLLQNLEIHGFSLIEQGNSYTVHANPEVKGVNSLYKGNSIREAQISTQVFTLQNVEADRCAAVISAMLSKNAIVQVIGNSKIVVSDLSENIHKLGEIIQKIDTQSSGLEIGQYVSINLSPAMLVSLSERIMAPLAGNKPIIMVPHSASNSVFIVSTPYLIERSLAVMQTLDLNQARSGVLWGDEAKFDPEKAAKARREIEQAESGEFFNIPPEMSREEVHNLSKEELDQLLLERGYTRSQVDALNSSEAKTLLWQEMNSIQEAKMRAMKRRQMYSESNLPLGSVESTQFLIYKLQYRNSKDVANALRSIATSLTSANTSGAGTSNASNQQVRPDIAQSDLVITLNSLQAVDDNNTIVFTGTRASLQKAKELISQIDIPVRQVFIEALVLDTSLNNSLQFGVEWGGKLERENFGTQIGFTRPTDSNFANAFSAIGQSTPNPIVPPTAGGLAAGAIGRKIKFRGKGFRSTGALINALHADDETHVMMNPKITTEHNIPAEIFVGERIPIKGQSIANATTGSTSSIVATNYETQEVGINLKVTPLISSHDTVTLIIEQKVSSANQASVQAQGANNAPPATVKETRTVTRVHLPSDHFLVMSGMIREEKALTNDRIPCLGGLPFIGSLFGSKKTASTKRNLLIFIRPITIDTPNDIDEITQKQEKILKAKSKVQQGWNKEVDDVLELLNL